MSSEQADRMGPGDCRKNVHDDRHRGDRGVDERVCEIRCCLWQGDHFEIGN